MFSYKIEVTYPESLFKKKKEIVRVRAWTKVRAIEKVLKRINIKETLEMRFLEK